MRECKARIRMSLRIAAAFSLVLGAVFALFPNPSPARTARTHVVHEITDNGRAVGAAAGVTVTRRGTVEHGIRRGETILDGSRIDVPAGVVVVIESSGAKSRVTLEPGASVTLISTGGGELLEASAGQSLFTVVPNSLDFFRVQSGEALTASVHGTEFSAEVTGGNVSYTCTRGEVNITKNGYLVIGEKRLPAWLLDVISAATRSRVTYHASPSWTLARFANFAEAESALSATTRRRGAKWRR